VGFALLCPLAVPRIESNTNWGSNGFVIDDHSDLPKKTVIMDTCMETINEGQHQSGTVDGVMCLVKGIHCGDTPTGERMKSKSNKQ
jgi:hypothetical protein